MARHLSIVLTILFASGFALGAGRADKSFRYETPYYILETDLPLKDVREAAVRLTSMFEEYHRIAKPYIQEVKKRQVVRIFSNQRDFIAAGGTKNMGGYYDPNTSMLNILFWRDSRDYGWQTVQHEAFHQFANTGKFEDYAPVWMNEGLADYFGNGLWTGGGLRTGYIPPGDLRKIQKYISLHELLPFAEMMAMDRKEWNNAEGFAQHRNYAQAWSMIHFLYHANNGKYVKPWIAFASAISRKPATRLTRSQYWKELWKNTFGPDVQSFQKEYEKWWSSLPANPTRDVYMAASVETLTTFMSRASVQGMKFEDYDAFVDAATSGKVVMKDDIYYWLPPELLTKALKDASKLREWSLEPGAKGRPKLVLRRNGQAITGSFMPKGNRPPEVQVTVAKADKPTSVTKLDLARWRLGDKNENGIDVLTVPFGKDLTVRVRRKAYDPVHQEVAILQNGNVAFRFLTSGKLGLPQAEYQGFNLGEDAWQSTSCDVDCDGSYDYEIYSAKDRVSIYLKDKWVKATMADLNPANGAKTADGQLYALDLKTQKWVQTTPEELEKNRPATQAASQPADSTSQPAESDVGRKWELAERSLRKGQKPDTLVIPLGEDTAVAVTIDPDRPERNEISVARTDSDAVIFNYKAKGCFDTGETRYSGLCDEPSERVTRIDLNADGQSDGYLFDGEERLMIWVELVAVEAKMARDFSQPVSTDAGSFKFSPKTGKWVEVKDKAGE